MTKERYLVIDLARTAALAGMVAFHFTYDLELFGLVAPGTAVTGWFWYHARIVAGSFIFLAGLSLWMAHGQGIRWPAFWRRLVKIGGTAGLVTLVTWATFSALGEPRLTIFYGILHSIAVSSLVGLLFLRLPAVGVLAVAAGVFALPYVWAHPAFDGWLIWTGLSGRVPITADYEPFFPWFAPFLGGIALGKIFSFLGLWPHLALPATPLLRRLAWPGQHSLAIYLIHQPVLIGLVLGAAWLLG
ncbi:heparan-alpha-glucosaminide N-acetyltransferase [Pseudogemmobacter blasticus]|nr:heparan-alpha-glucosaminide N-acetyltransferase [Fuscovulum blasticum]